MNNPKFWSLSVLWFWSNNWLNAVVKGGISDRHIGFAAAYNCTAESVRMRFWVLHEMRINEHASIMRTKRCALWPLTLCFAVSLLLSLLGSLPLF